MGRNTVTELLRLYPKRLKTLYLSKKEDPLCQKGHPFEMRSFDQLTKLVKSESHQGVVALVDPPQECSLKQLIQIEEEKQRTLILALDSITDPHNLGAILRAAECLGVAAVLYSKNRGVDVTPTVTKVSSGASEIVPIVPVSNLATALNRLKDAYYEVATAELADDSKSIYDHQFSDKTVLVLGSEGKGIRPLIHKLSDAHLMIPMKGRLDSLNVSQAAAVFLSFWNLKS